jgi:hypothetical protein
VRRAAQIDLVLLRCRQPGAVSPRRTDQAGIFSPGSPRMPAGHASRESPADLGYVVLSMMRS